MKESLEELRKAYDELGKKIEKLEEEKQNIWPKDEDMYYYIEDSCGIDYCFYRSDNIDYWRKINNNIFKTKEDAEKWFDIHIKLNKIIDELGRPKWEDLKNSEEYYFIYFDKAINKIGETTSYIIDGAAYSYGCKESSKAKAIKEIGEDNLIWYFTCHMKTITA